MKINVKDILNICNGKLLWGDEETVCENFSKDTRTIQQNDVYIGIKGANFDGNTLFENAFEKGAKVCIIQDIKPSDDIKNKYNGTCCILVEDTILALQKIASYKRDLYDIPVIAITGSVGKTSTKDIVASVVGTEFNVLKTQGNLNNHIGLPLTILGLKEHNALVVEMGMNNLGEISVLSKIAKPNIAIITNVGTSHIGNLGSRENILKAKLEILDGLKKDGILIINNDNDLLHNWASNNKDANLYTYGINNKSDIMAKDIVFKESSSEFIVDADNTNKNEKIIVPIGGEHFVYNALCAVIVGKLLKICDDNIKYGIQKFELTKSRMELINLENNILLINDCYNANYDSMKAGIEYLAKINSNRKIAVLGDMLELGEFAYELHKKVGNEILKNNIDILITVGEMGKVISDTVMISNKNVFHCDNNKQAVDCIQNIVKDNDVIFVKASNGMNFKEIVDEIKNCYVIKSAKH